MKDHEWDQLAKDMLAGSSVAAEVLFRKVLSYSHHLVQRYCGNLRTPLTADEIAVEITGDLFLAAKQWRMKASFFTFATSVLRNSARKTSGRMRNRLPISEYPDSAIATKRPGPSEEVEMRELLNRVFSGCNPADMLSILREHLDHPISTVDVASLLDVAESTIRSRASRHSGALARAISRPLQSLVQRLRGLRSGEIPFSAILEEDRSGGSFDSALALAVGPTAMSPACRLRSDLLLEAHRARIHCKPETITKKQARQLEIAEGRAEDVGVYGRLVLLHFELDPNPELLADAVRGFERQWIHYNRTCEDPVDAGIDLPDPHTITITPGLEKYLTAAFQAVSSELAICNTRGVLHFSAALTGPGVSLEVLRIQFSLLTHLLESCSVDDQTHERTLEYCARAIGKRCTEMVRSASSPEWRRDLTALKADIRRSDLIDRIKAIIAVGVSQPHHRLLADLADALWSTVRSA